MLSLSSHFIYHQFKSAIGSIDMTKISCKTLSQLIRSVFVEGHLGQYFFALVLVLVHFALLCFIHYSSYVTVGRWVVSIRQVLSSLSGPSISSVDPPA